jgi:hypothetical protein
MRGLYFGVLTELEINYFNLKKVIASEVLHLRQRGHYETTSWVRFASDRPPVASQLCTHDNTASNYHLS